MDILAFFPGGLHSWRRQGVSFCRQPLLLPLSFLLFLCKVAPLFLFTFHDTHWDSWRFIIYPGSSHAASYLWGCLDKDEMEVVDHQNTDTPGTQKQEELNGEEGHIWGGYVLLNYGGLHIEIRNGKKTLQITLVFVA